MSRKIYTDHQGRPYMILRNRRIGSQRQYLTLTARCHICDTPEEVTYQGVTTYHPLTSCSRCGKMACPAHYDYHLRLCSDCAALYKPHSQEGSQRE